MRLGIDFGTTRSVVAVVDRGNYPVVSFRMDDGELLEWFPSLIAQRKGVWKYGLDALAVVDKPGWAKACCFKRMLGDLHPDDPVAVGDATMSALEMVTNYLASLLLAVKKRGNVTLRRNEELEVFCAVPADANNNQRFLTMEAFKRAGFKVRGLVNEPAAAGIEFAHALGAARKQGKQVIYDLGGGTFDAAVIGMGEAVHETLSNEGLGRFGAMDFDRVMAEMAQEKAGIEQELTAEQHMQLLAECRERKEGLHANTRKLAIDMSRALPGADPVIFDVAEFYDRCKPLIDQTIATVNRAVEVQAHGKDEPWEQIANVYVVGGGAQMPAVMRQLRDTYGRKVRKSAYPHAAIAIGLAIAADGEMGYSLQERFTRYFGVWRERDGGASIAFDPIFSRGTLLPSAGEGEVLYRRNYRPTHNIGHFRYLECGSINEQHEPDGDITPWETVLFPFKPELEGQDLSGIPIKRSNTATTQSIEEVYRCDARGVVKVTIKNQTSGYKQSFVLRP